MLDTLKDQLGWIIPVMSAVGGFAGGVALVFPAIRRTQNAVLQLKRTIERLHNKYKNTLPVVMKGDARALLTDVDAVTENAADVAKALASVRFPKAKEAEQFLRRLIHAEWYENW